MKSLNIVFFLLCIFSSTWGSDPPKKLICKKNEIVVPCSPICPPELDCSRYLQPVSILCAQPPEDDPCVPRCECAKGFVRSSKGICIKPDTCCEDPNATVVSCPSPCPKTCKKPNGEQNCPKFCKLRGCVCKNGFVLDDNGRCIRPEECPKKLVCKKNEVVVPCSPICPPELDCNRYLQPVDFLCAQPPEDAPCVPRCECAQGFVRNSKGICVKPDTCCEDPNATVVDCPSPCPKTCKKPNGEPNCPEFCQLRGCVCKDGFVLDDNGKCIKQEECPILCGENETVNQCPEFCTFEEDCDSYVRGWIKDCTFPSVEPPCKPRCDCADGFVRINGICQLPNKCCTDPNEEVVECPAACEATCKGKPNPDCTMEDCYKRMCRCKEGYVRDDKGACIRDTDCPQKQCKGVNQQYMLCGSACPPTCEKKNLRCPARCVEGCFCKKGFVLHKGKCIKPSMCP